MSEFALNALGVIGVLVVVAITMYRLGPGLSDALSAWAKKQETITAHRLVEEWADGYVAGREMELARQGRAEWKL